MLRFYIHICLYIHKFMGFTYIYIYKYRAKMKEKMKFNYEKKLLFFSHLSTQLSLTRSPKHIRIETKRAKERERERRKEMEKTFYMKLNEILFFKKFKLVFFKHFLNNALPNKIKNNYYSLYFSFDNLDFWARESRQDAL